jgi:hypothetical protein
MIKPRIIEEIYFSRKIQGDRIAFQFMSSRKPLFSKQEI